MSRPSPLRGPWLRLANAYGGAEALANALGVHPSTVSRWAREVVPVSSPSKTAIRWAARAVGVRSPV